MNTLEKTLGFSVLVIGLGLSAALALTLPILSDEAHMRGDHATALYEFRPLVREEFEPTQSFIQPTYKHNWGIPSANSGAARWHRKKGDLGNAEAQVIRSSIRSLNGRMPMKVTSMLAINGEVAKEVPSASAVDRSHPYKPPQAPAGNAFRVQLDSFKTRALAVKQAARLSHMHESVLRGADIVLVRANLGRRGIFYRLQAAPFHHRAAADALCRKLSARRQKCFVITP